MPSLLPVPSDSGVATTAPTAPATRKPAARSRQTMVVMAAEHPSRLLPPAANATEDLLTDLLYDPLYRLDDAVQPVPELAMLPEVSRDGLTLAHPHQG